MAGHWFRALLVLSLVLLVSAGHTRKMRHDLREGNGGVIIDPLVTDPPIPEPVPALSPLAEQADGNDGVVIDPIVTDPPIPDPLPDNDGPIPVLSSSPEINEGLFEGDIVLTQEERLQMQQGRKATSPSLYWPRDSSGTVTVGYRFGDNIVNKLLVKSAITQWETSTCIRFKEVPANVGRVHLKFINSGGCASYVGRISSMTTGQNIWLAPSCVTEIGPTVHEIGHALGFFHEQSRSDRGNYVEIMWANIQSGSANNFASENTLNYGVPYDYGSVMHYGPKYFSKNGNPTIRAKNPLGQSLMGNRRGLTFADKLLANKMYGCLRQWLHQRSLTSDPCQNMGYTGPHGSCVCPDGTSGAQCEVLHDSYTDALINKVTPYSETITTEGVVSTPGYPTPIQSAMKFVKLLVAPECHRVNLTFTDLHVYGRTVNNECAIDSLTVQTQDALGSGTSYCGEEIAPGTVFTSETNTIELDYYNYNYDKVSWSSKFRGFSATIEHIPIDGCNPTTGASDSRTDPSITFNNSGN